MAEAPVFIKSFPKMTAAEVAILAAHALEISATLDGSPDVIFPRVLAHEGQDIRYEFVNCKDPLLERLKIRSCTGPDLEKAGRIMRRIHDTLAKSTDTRLLHGDYVPHNLFYSGTRLVLIDPHPPENLDFKHERLYGQPLDEVVSFIFCLLSSPGLKQSICHFAYFSQLANGFFDGYGQDGLNLGRFWRPVIRNARDVYRLKRKAGFSRGHAVVHCLAGVILTFRLLRAAL